jgi:aspartate-semialdehyde dehydrogenase
MVEREIPLEEIRLLASRESDGVRLVEGKWRGQVRRVVSGVHEGLDVLFAIAPAAICADQIPIALGNGALVIDLSDASRDAGEAPLVVASINDELVEGSSQCIASPRAQTVQLAHVIDALRTLGVPVHVDGTLLAPASQLGRTGMEILAQQAIALFNQSEMPRHAIGSQLAFNAIPAVGGFSSTTEWSHEEIGVARELRRVLDEPDLTACFTAAHVPVFAGQSAAITVELDSPTTRDAVLACLSDAPGLALQDSPKERLYPEPGEVAGCDEVCVGRVRVDGEGRRVSLWLSSDNVRLGGAANALDIFTRWRAVQSE